MWKHRGMSKARDAHLDEVLIGGREQGWIEVIDYDDAWPSRFRYFAERVRAALGDRALSIEHIGSTAVVDAQDSGEGRAPTCL